MRGLTADNNNKLYTETMIFLWNNHYNLIFNEGLSQDKKKLNNFASILANLKIILQHTYVTDKWTGLGADGAL